MTQEAQQADPLEDVTQICGREVKEEYENILQIILTMLSAFTNDPQNTRVLARSGEGKTNLVNHVAEFFPQENILKLANATPQSFKYSSTRRVIETYPNNFEEYDAVIEPLEERLKETKDKEEKRQIQNEIKSFKDNTYDIVNFENKCLIFLDAQSMELWESLKTNLSHDDKFIKSLGVNKDGGVIKGQKIVFSGWPAVIYCSAKDEIGKDKTDEINSRFNTISLRGKPPKYRKVLELASLQKSLPDPIYEEEVVSQKEIEEAKMKVQQMIENVRKYGKAECPVLNLFGMWIPKQFKNDAGYRARQEKILLNNITMLTLCRADQRPKVIIGDEEYPIVLKSDVVKANELTKESMPIAISKIQFFNEKIKPAIASIGKERPLVDGKVVVATAREIADEINDKNPTMSIDRKNLLETYLQPLVDHGYLEGAEDPANKTRHIFWIPSKYLREDAKFESTYIDTSTIDDSCVNLFIEKYLKCRFEEGKVRIFDKLGKEITLKELSNVVNQIDITCSKSEYKNNSIDLSNIVDSDNQKTTQGTIEAVG